MRRLLFLRLLPAFALSPVVLALPSIATASASASGPLPDAAPWARVLERFERRGGLDYQGLRADPGDLLAYTSSLAAADPEDAPRSERLAFWINAYNAVVARFVVELDPDLDSVREVDGFFDGRRFPVAGSELTLDEIEERALALDEPRVHFAVVCASTSCPDLRGEPYEAGPLERQLAEQTSAFLADEEKGLRFDPGENVVWLSSIFKWYGDDFTGGSRVGAFLWRGKVLDWILERLPPERARELTEARPAVRYLDYDWSLNDRPEAPEK